MYDHEKRKGGFFFSRIQKETEQDNPFLWFPLFLLPQEPGRYILATLPGLVNGGDLFDLKHPQKMFTCVNRI